MNLVELTDEGLNEGLIENDVTEELLVRFLQNLRLEEEVALLTDLVF